MRTMIHTPLTARWAAAVLFVAVAGTAPMPSFAYCEIVDGRAYGDCDGVILPQRADSILMVEDQITVSGIVAGATVLPGGALYLTGISNGDIVVYRGGHLTVTGIVKGAVRNRGGSVTIDGTVKRLVSNGGRVRVSGIVESFSGRGPVSFQRGSILGDVPLDRSRRLP